MPDEAGIARISAAGQFYQFRHCAGIDVEAGERRMYAAVEHSPGRDPAAARNLDEIRSAETVETLAEIAPLPLGVVVSADAQHGGPRLALPLVIMERSS